MHGNEPAGCEAMLRVLRRLARDALPLRGELWGLAGNLRALAANRRYLDRDLNRRWIREDIARIVANGPEAAIEDTEQLELLGILAPLLDRAREAIVFFDLHSTSGPAAPFSCMADVLRNRKIARAPPIPVVLGLEGGHRRLAARLPVRPRPHRRRRRGRPAHGPAHDRQPRVGGVADARRRRRPRPRTSARPRRAPGAAGRAGRRGHPGDRGDPPPSRGPARARAPS
ncbi:MAG: succinylglutamate desuccinylase/aspartoacylase family protein [Nannocystis sp.]|nr:succinylglutamate desuccinylase/aspartoacylase family protein [Nannocystis sp.]